MDPDPPAEANNEVVQVAESDDDDDSGFSSSGCETDDGPNPDYYVGFMTSRFDDDDPEYGGGYDDRHLVDRLKAARLVFMASGLPPTPEDWDAMETAAADSQVTCPLQERISWLKNSVMKPPAESLREKSARAVADSWFDEQETKNQLKAMDSLSGSAYFFKTEVGAQLEGQRLAAYLHHEGGLVTLESSSWPEVFQRIVAKVYLEMSKFGQSPQARRNLSRCIKVYREETEAKESTVPMAVHRLGLTQAFQQTELEETEHILILGYYNIFDDRSIKPQCLPKLVYPLPAALQVRTPTLLSSESNSCKFYRVGEATVRRYRAWLKKTPPDQIRNEEKGLVLSESTRKGQIDRCDYHCAARTDCLWIKAETLSPDARHILTLSVMTQRLFNGSPVQSLVAALLALIHPFYSAQRSLLARQHRLDIYWFISKSLGWLHAKLDVVLACHQMAKNLVMDVGGPVCLGEQARLVLMQQEMFVRYGFYDRARELFLAWFGRFPSTGWLHEELVMLHTAGVIYSVQDTLFAFQVTKSLHSLCDFNQFKKCAHLHLKPMLRSVSNRLLVLRGILYRCLSDPAIRPNFRQDCLISVELCELYLLTVKTAGQEIIYPFTTYYYMEIRALWEKIQMARSAAKFSSRHLEPFTRPICSFVRSELHWKELFDEIQIRVRGQLKNDTRAETPRLYADYLFTLLVITLFHRKNFDCDDFVQDTVDAYLESTGGRHHRLFLLWRYKSYHFRNSRPLKEEPGFNPDRDLTAEQRRESLAKQPNLYHPNRELRDVTAEFTTTERAQRFAAETMRDALENFESEDFSTAEKFCGYLRQRDNNSDFWIEAGLLCYRFDYVPE